MVDAASMLTRSFTIVQLAVLHRPHFIIRYCTSHTPTICLYGLNSCVCIVIPLKSWLHPIILVAGVQECVPHRHVAIAFGTYLHGSWKPTVSYSSFDRVCPVVGSIHELCFCICSWERIRQTGAVPEPRVGFAMLAYKVRCHVNNTLCASSYFEYGYT